MSDGARESLVEAASAYEVDVRRQVALWLRMARQPLREADERCMGGGAAQADDLQPVLDQIARARQAVREAERLLHAEPKLPEPRFGLTVAEHRREQRAREA